MEEEFTDSPRTISKGAVAAMVCAIGFGIFFGYNALNQKPAARLDLSLNTVDLKPDRIGKLISTDSPSITQKTSVRVDPAGLPKADRSDPQAALVLTTQRQLKALGHYNGSLDSSLNGDTRRAIIRYQQAAGLPITGKPGTALLEHIRFTRQIANAANITASTSRAPDEITILEVQSRLAELGYQPGPADGAYGSKTRQAILQFQQDRNLPQDGEITPRLASELAKVKGQSAFQN